LRKVFGFLAVLLVVAVAALLAAPSFIDWNRWKPEIEARLAAATGRAVAIEGPVTLALLPYPEASAHGLRVATRAGSGSPELARVKTLEIRLDLGALLSGRLVAASLRLVEPVLELPLPEWREGGGGAIGIDRLAVERGTLIWRRAGGVERIEAIDMVAGIDSLAGPFRAKGSARWRGTAFRFEGDSGAIGARMPLALALDLGKAGRIEGRADLVDGTAKGRIAASGEDLGTMLQALGAPAPWAAGRSFALSGALTASTAAVAVENASLGLDEARGTGAFALRLGAVPSLEARLALPSLDLDRWRAAPGGGGGFALPEGIAAHVDAGIDVLRLNGNIVRQARLDARLAAGALQITRAAALLPGGADVALAGTLAAENGAPRFTGSLELAADNLRELLAWAGAPLPALPPDRLRRTTLTSRFTLRPQRLDVTALDLSLDATRITGAATVALRDRIGIGARLALDRLVLDPYLAALGKPGNDAGLPLDLNLEASVEQLAWRGQSLAGVKLAATLQQGALTLREASVRDLAGAAVTLSGESRGGRVRGAVEASGPELARLIRLWSPGWTRSLGAFRLEANGEGDLVALTLDAKLDALGGAASVKGATGLGRAADLAVAAQHPSLRRLLAALGYRSAGEPGPLAASFRLESERDTWRAKGLAIEAGGTRITGDVTLAAGGAKPHLEARLEAGALTLDPYLPVRQSAGLPIQLAQASGRGPAPVDLWSREPLDLSWLAAFDGRAALGVDTLRWGAWRLDGARTALQVADGALALTRIEGRLFGGALAGEGRLGEGFAAKLSLEDADLAAIGFGGAVEGKGTLALDVAASGQSPYEIVSRLAGSARITARNGSLEGIDLRAVSDQLHKIDRITDLLGLVRGASGSTPFSTLDGTFRIERGIARSEDLKLRAEASEGTAIATVDLPSWFLDAAAAFRLVDHPDAPPLGVILEGPLDAPRRSFDTRALQQYLAGRGIERLLRELPR
jgi:uncharacterized protein involved in outer membrane biogenesis